MWRALPPPGPYTRRAPVSDSAARSGPSVNDPLRRSLSGLSHGNSRSLELGPVRLSIYRSSSLYSDLMERRVVVRLWIDSTELLRPFVSGSL